MQVSLAGWRSKRSPISSFLGFALAVLTFVLANAPGGYAIPAFARKYGLPCSACHIGWPILNTFGQSFRDNGYQLGNDRDSPIYQNPSYLPITFRITPQWHRESSSRQAVDVVPGSAAGGQVEQTITNHGFDLSGLDLWTAGTLYKNISFLLLPSSDQFGSFHFESAWVRFDNLLNSRWLNLKFGKFELDNLLSEKRFLALTTQGGTWYNYHFLPPGDITSFHGIGDNQLGMELMGHSKNSYIRYSIALLSSADGQPGLASNTTAAGGPLNNTAHTYDAYANVNYGFEIPGLGVQRVGGLGYFGQSPTYFKTSGGTPIQAAGTRSFSRVGAYGWWFFKDFDVETFYLHGQDNVFLGNGVPANNPSALLPGAAGPSWNGGFVEGHYAYSPQLVLTGRYELVHLSRQANPTIPGTVGNVNNWTLGYRWYPIMFSRAGLAWHQEYSRSVFSKTSPLTGSNQQASSFLSGFDFDF